MPGRRLRNEADESRLLGRMALTTARPGPRSAPDAGISGRCDERTAARLTDVGDHEAIPTRRIGTLALTAAVLVSLPQR
jgi:hypothetical protein